METGKANNIQASTFKTSLCEQYHLSVQFGLKQFSYCIINRKTKYIEYFNNIIQDKNILEVINNDKNLKLEFKSSSVVFTNFPYTLVPNELFLKENSKKTLELNSDIFDKINTDKLQGLDAHLIYSVPEVIIEIVSTFFPNSTQKAQETILIQQFNKFLNKNDNAYLYLSENTLNITVFRNGKLIFNNSFKFSTKEDILYFTLFTFEQLKLNTETVIVKVYGEIKKIDDNYKLLYEYIRNIELGSKVDYLNLSQEFNELQDHEFYALFSQSI